jgi:CheY-like chemotaxis protein
MELEQSRAPYAARSTPLSLRVFVVEDHAETLKYMLLFLRQLGCETSHARNLAEAIKVLREPSFDVMISDISLTDGEGWELTRQMKAHPEVYCISMSGLNIGPDSAKWSEAGFHYHLHKPFLPRELEQVLCEVAQRKAEDE